MDLLKNAGLLRTLLRIAGIRNISATTDTPAALITLHFESAGIEHDPQFSVQELLDNLTQTTAGPHSEPSGNFTDIADLP